MKTNAPSIFTRLGAIAAVALLAGTIAACSTTNSDSTDKTESPAAGKSPKTSTLTYDDWTVKFDSCMLDQGIEPPKRESSDSASIDMNNFDMDKYTKASETCLDKVGQAPAREGQLSNEEANAKQLKMVQCLRDRGYTLDDPKGGILGIPENVTQEDVTACSKD